MKLEIEIPNALLVDYIERANIKYWGDAQEWDPKKMILTLQEHEESGTITLGPDEWAIGIRTMIRFHSNMFRQLMSDQGDMYTGDILIQCAAFGEEKYA